MAFSFAIFAGEEKGEGFIAANVSISSSLRAVERERVLLQRTSVFRVFGIFYTQLLTHPCPVPPNSTPTFPLAAEYL